MNHRFDDLMYAAGLTAQGCWADLDDYARAAIMKFAELIIEECANWLEETGSMVEVAMEMKQHFGVDE